MPIYIWMTAILFFAALAFFAFAQAASARNGAQSAADAAALAAAQSARDELLLDLGEAVGNDDDWTDVLDLDGLAGLGDGAGAAASDLAAQNDATVVAGPNGTTVNGYPGYEVEVETQSTVGDTVIPGTESMHATAHATAVLVPRCDFDTEADPEKPLALDCDGVGEVVIDPEDFDPLDLPDASDLFSVHLAD
ncbi:pilus assembly protein TadG-related protein [Streptomyces kunmingensis]|uniref:Pilus assembly protein TadG-related protein n=1 Tax=Streptomyces kunmingensis TaxID=68225 RepID=A0ABU6CH46_9ACTN|nr:pilus assembly protein TadG-related protein [Streptomyces kunmingensis]